MKERKDGKNEVRQGGRRETRWEIEGRRERGREKRKERQQTEGQKREEREEGEKKEVWSKSDIFKVMRMCTVAAHSPRAGSHPTTLLTGLGLLDVATFSTM